MRRMPRSTRCGCFLVVPRRSSSPATMRRPRPGSGRTGYAI
jgi:hypothetical protein